MFLCDGVKEGRTCDASLCYEHTSWRSDGAAFCPECFKLGNVQPSNDSGSNPARKKT